MKAAKCCPKEGGVAGIGGVNKLNTATLPADHFTEIDITNTLEITIGGTKAKLASHRRFVSLGGWRG
ncbi:MAG: hypothetical protein IPH05_06970 [Flavobacteriales bacterium]|nr:hypothetical protein [Flavobacteriales bacterium]